MGQQCLQGHITHSKENYSFDFENFISGTYFIKLTNKTVVVFSVKVINE